MRSFSWPSGFWTLRRGMPTILAWPSWTETLGKGVPRRHFVRNMSKLGIELDRVEPTKTMCLFPKKEPKLNNMFGGLHEIPKYLVVLTIFFRFYETCINPLKTSWLVCFVHPEHLSYDIPMNPKNDSFLSLYELPFAIDISPSAPRFIDITTWIQYKTITRHRVYTLYSGYIPTYGGHRYL